MRGKPAGSTIRMSIRWYGPGEPGVGDLVVTEAGHAAYIVESAVPTGGHPHAWKHRTLSDEHGRYATWKLELTKLDPDDVPSPDWTLFRR